MAIFNADERAVAEALGALSFANPFLPERIRLEQQVLGEAFVPISETWSADPVAPGENANIRAIRALAASLSETARTALVSGVSPLAGELQIYEDVVLYELYYRYEDRFYQDIVSSDASLDSRRRRVGYFDAFENDVAHFFNIPGFESTQVLTADRLFALFFQHRRAFHFIFRRIFGGSMAASRLRAAVWESVFTRDMRRYRRALFDRMHDTPTLITGPSGTGKELVAGAIGLSRFIPFDPANGQFKEPFGETFHPLNLSALAPTLIESELFGHKKGAFTGAMSDRHGYLENRGPHHTVFLDEIGDVAPSIQLKLLRVLQTREFQALGETCCRRFGGKIVAATNRNLTRAIEEAAFREDLYYRLCADHIVTPSLEAQFAEDPDQRRDLIALIAETIVGRDERDAVTEEVDAWVRDHLGNTYPWPGNIRELEQCIRNILVHGAYHPLERPQAATTATLADDFLNGRVSADRLLSIYMTLVYHQTGQYQETARRLDVDRRTVKARIDEALLDALAEGSFVHTDPSKKMVQGGRER